MSNKVFKVVEKNRFIIGILALVLVFTMFGGGLQFAGGYGGTTLSLDKVKTQWTDSRFGEAYLISYVADGKGETAFGTMLKEGDNLPNNEKVGESLSLGISDLSNRCRYPFVKVGGEGLKKLYYESKTFSGEWFESDALRNGREWCDGLNGEFAVAPINNHRTYYCYFWGKEADIARFKAKETMWEMDFKIEIGNEVITKTLNNEDETVGFNDLAYVHVPGSAVTGYTCEEYSSDAIVHYQNKWVIVDKAKVDIANNYASSGSVENCVDNAQYNTDLLTCFGNANTPFIRALAGSNSHLADKATVLDEDGSGGSFYYDLEDNLVNIPIVQVYVNAEKITAEGLGIDIPVSTPKLTECKGVEFNTGESGYVTALLGVQGGVGGNFVVKINDCDAGVVGKTSKTIVVGENEEKSVVFQINDHEDNAGTCYITAYSKSDPSLKDSCAIDIKSVGGGSYKSCLSDSDCSDGYECTKNVCVKIDNSSDVFGGGFGVSPLLLLIGGIGLLLIIYVFVGDDGNKSSTRIIYRSTRSNKRGKKRSSRKGKRKNRK